MTLNPTTHAGRALSVHDIVRALLIVAAVVIFLAALNMAFGMPQVIYQIVPDPAGPLPY